MNTNEIWFNFRDRLLNFIKSRVRNVEDSEDILQEVFIKIHQKSKQLENELKLTSWIFQITRNTIIDFYRKKRIPISESVLFEPQEDLEEELNPQLLSCLMPFIDKLLPKDKDALMKTVYGNLSQKEYAKELNLSYSATKSRVQRAKLKLKDLFSECCNIKTDKYGNVISSEIDDCTC